MTEIPLSKGQVALIDDEDAALIQQFKWCAGWNESSKTYYAYRGISPAKSPTGRARLVLMHRFIMDVPHGDKRMVDHQDHNGLNNQRGNLRVCTRSRNMQAAIGSRSRRLSRFKGASRSSSGKLWTARIRVDGKPLYLGTFRTEEEAALAYDRAALIHFGEFALTNAVMFPTLLAKEGAA